MLSVLAANRGGQSSDKRYGQTSVKKVAIAERQRAFHDES